MNTMNVVMINAYTAVGLEAEPVPVLSEVMARDGCMPRDRAATTCDGAAVRIAAALATDGKLQAEIGIVR